MASADAVDPASPTIDAVTRPGISAAIRVVNTTAASDEMDTRSGLVSVGPDRVAQEAADPGGDADHAEQQLGERAPNRRTRS